MYSAILTERLYGSRDFDAISATSYGMVAIKCVDGVYSFYRNWNASGAVYNGRFLRARYKSGSEISISTLADCHVRWGTQNYNNMHEEHDQNYASETTLYNNTSFVTLFYATEPE